MEKTKKLPLAAASVGRFVLSNEEQMVPLAPRPAEALSMPDSIHSQSGRAILLLDDLVIERAAGVTYDIYLVSKRDPKTSKYVATLSYFGLAHMQHAGHEAGGKPGVKLLYYDVTSQLAELEVMDAEHSGLAVRFVPTTGIVTKEPRKLGAPGRVTIAGIRLLKAP